MRRLLSVISMLVAVGCTEPEPAISGQFGGRLMELSATSSAAHFRLACGQIATSALRTGATRTAHVTGTATFQGAGVQPVQVNVDVQMVHSYYLHVVIHFPSGSSEVFELLRNARGDFSGVGCVA